MNFFDKLSPKKTSSGVKKSDDLDIFSKNTPWNLCQLGKRTHSIRSFQLLKKKTILHSSHKDQNELLREFYFFYNWKVWKKTRFLSLKYFSHDKNSRPLFSLKLHGIFENAIFGEIYIKICYRASLTRFLITPPTKTILFQISPCEPQKIPKTLLEVTDLSGVPDVC